MIGVSTGAWARSYRPITSFYTLRNKRVFLKEIAEKLPSELANEEVEIDQRLEVEPEKLEGLGLKVEQGKIVKKTPETRLRRIVRETAGYVLGVGLLASAGYFIGENLGETRVNDYVDSNLARVVEREKQDYSGNDWESQERVIRNNPESFMKEVQAVRRDSKIAGFGTGGWIGAICGLIAQVYQSERMQVKRILRRNGKRV